VEKQVEFVPYHDRVLVKQDEAKEKTSGRIEIPDSQREPPLEGVVLAVGPGRAEMGQFIPVTAQVGEQVVFGKYGGTPITIDGIQYLILRDEEILGRRPPADPKPASK
jgi:chaperonin GroES